MEHLFKLKRDGKTVGYLKIRDGVLLGSIIDDVFTKQFTYITEQNQSRGIYLYRDIGIPFIDFDSAHPFVTKDKNGKDVFAGDEVWFHWMGKKTKAKIVKDDLFIRLKACKGEAQGLPRTFCKSDRFHIEIIEDKENGL